MGWWNGRLHKTIQSFTITIFSAAGKRLNVNEYVAAWSVIRRLTVCESSVPFALTMLTIHSLTASSGYMTCSSKIPSYLS